LKIHKNFKFNVGLGINFWNTQNLVIDGYSNDHSIVNHIHYSNDLRIKDYRDINNWILYESNCVAFDYSFRKNGMNSDPNYSNSTNWNFKLNHSQTIDPTTRLDANLQFSSQNYNSQNVTNLNQVLNLSSQIVSSATLFKTWEEAGNSLSLSYYRTQDIQTGNTNEVLPNLTFQMSQKYPFRRNGVFTDQKWYELIGIGYSGEFENLRDKINDNLNIRGGFSHQITTSFSPKIGYFNFTPNFSYYERWYNKYSIEEIDKSPVTGNDTLIVKDGYKLNAVRTFNTGVSVQTRFYGIFNPDVLGIASIRHSVTPSLSYNYTPDFSKSGWGYYANYTDTNGQKVKYDKFQNGVFGATPQGESQSVSFSLDNLFEMKTKVDPTDTTSKEKAIEAGIYDPEREYKPLFFRVDTGQIIKGIYNGVLGMKERAQACGGSVQVSSSPGEGTTITVCVPLQASSAEQGQLAHTDSR